MNNVKEQIKSVARDRSALPSGEACAEAPLGSVRTSQNRRWLREVPETNAAGGVPQSCLESRDPKRLANLSPPPRREQVPSSRSWAVSCPLLAKLP